MAQEMRDQARFSEEQQQQSPYVAQSGQPTSVESAQAMGDRGLHLGGKHTGQPQHEHPLEATHDTNIGHGHEPFPGGTTESGYVAPAGAGDPEQQHLPKRGMSEKMKDAMRGVKEVVVGHKDKTSPRSGERIPEQQQQQQHPGLRSGERIPEQQQQQHPGFVDKMKDAVTGQKPGHGTATGYATAGSAVPGEEDYAGKVDRRKSPAEAGVEQHDPKWPRPVPPPGISDTSVPQEHHRPNVGAPETLHPGGDEYAGEKFDKPGAAGAYNAPQHIDERVPGQHAAYNPEQGSYPGENRRPDVGAPERTHPGGEEYKSGAAAGTYNTSQNIDERVPGQQAAYNAEQGRYPAQSTVDTAGGGGSYEQQPRKDDDIFLYRKDEDRRPADTGMSAAKDEVHGSTDPSMISTPAAPDTRHETPSVETQGGAEYTDSHGKVHREGPRDDNVKKEGLMSKMMDKLHIGSHKQREHKDTTTTTGA